MHDRYAIHPLCALLPSMQLCNPDEYLAMISDMAAHGYVGEPVILYEGRILDGRNRYEAWIESGHDGDLPVEQFNGTEEEAWALVKRKNFVRRHLTQFQRAVIEAQRLKSIISAHNCASTISERELAALAGVSQGIASAALDVLRYLDDETVGHCIDGSVSRTAAEDLIAPAMKHKTKAEQDAEEDRAEFYRMVDQVLEGKYTRESLATTFGIKSPGVAMSWFIRCCELAPDVTVIRDYGPKQLAYFEFRREA